MPANTEPIPVGLALRLCEMAIDDCDKATPGPWQAIPPDEHTRSWFVSRLPHNSSKGTFYVVALEPKEDSDFLVLSRAVMRPLIGLLKAFVRGFGNLEHDDQLYPPLAALRDYYDKTRPDWRVSK